MTKLFITILLLIILFSIFIRFYTQKNHKTNEEVHKNNQNLTLSEKQLRAIQNADFNKNKVMNSKEYFLYKRLHGYLQNNYPKYNIFPQVVMGSYLNSVNNWAFRAINSKRTDFLVVDPSGYPVIAIEYQGKGHYQANAIYRDTIKREVLRKSGIHYHEIKDNYDEQDIYIIGQFIDKSSSVSN